MPERVTRYDQGTIRWEERDLRLLPWIYEQHIIRLDHLEELAGRWPGKATKEAGRIAKPTAEGLVRRWRRAGAVESGTLLVRQPIWCWVTSRGQTLMGLAGRPWTPTIRGYRGLEHRYYVNQVRLWLEQAHPDAIWTSERLLWQRQPARSTSGPRQLVPDAEVELAGRRIAVEVELTAKTEARWQELLEAHAARYDQVWYFAPGHLHRDLHQALHVLEEEARAKFSLSQVNEAAYRLGR